MIEVRSLSKKFADLWALKDTSWQVRDRRSLGLLGPNGAGKSTTMKIMTGLLCSTEGQVLIDGEDILHCPVEAKRKIGYLPETPPLYSDLKVYDFLNFICGLKSVVTSRRALQIDSAVEKLSLQEVAFKPIRVLSKGFRQRVGIAQALIGDPSILILDEPSVGLDPHQVFELRNIIKSLKKDHIIILSTHILSEVEQICDDVVILDKGRVKSQGSLQELLASRQKVSTISLEVDRESQALVNSIKNLEGVDKLETQGVHLQVFLKKGFENMELTPFIELVAKSKRDLISIGRDSQRLEDVFIEVTK